MSKYLKLRGEIVSKGLDMKRLSNLMGKSAPYIALKVSERAKFSLSDIQEICKILDINDPERICEIFEIL